MKPGSGAASVLQTFRLDDRVALVTGGAGQLGREFSRALLEAGASVVLADRIPASLKTVTEDLSRCFPGRVRSLRLDITDRSAVVRAFDRLKRQQGRLDVLINNAGIGIFTPFDRRSADEVSRAVDINVKGTLWCSQQAAAVMKERRRGGVIVNIGSVYGVVSADPRIYGDSGRNSSEIYAGTKAAIIQMTRYLAVHLAPYGIRVNCLSPGGVFNKQSPAFVRNYCRKTPLGRMAYASDLKGALIFLSSEASAYVTGHNLLVDGGFTVW